MKIILVADNDHTREKGLMFHKELEKDECAFFKFNREAQHVFWNKNVSFPISLIYCDASGEVKDIKTLEKEQTKPVKPESYDIKYVVETHIDAPEIYGIEKGKKMLKKDKEVIFQ